MPLKPSCRQWAGREALGSPLLRPLGSRAPLTLRETDKPAEGQTQSHAFRAAASPPPSPWAQESGLWASPAHQPPPISPLLSSLLSYPNPREEMGGSYAGRVLGSSTLGMKGIAGEPRSPQSFQGASVFNKNSYLSTCTRLLASRSSAGEGRSPASDLPHCWSSGLAAVTLSLCKNLLLIADVEPEDSLLCLLRKVFLFIYFLKLRIRRKG